jgi:biopolymer transport protein ExbD
MITRPLELSSRLRPEPRSFDALFYVNSGLIAVFFLCFGSRFVLAPGLSIKVPEMPGVRAMAVPTDSVISVLPSGQIFADGLLNMAQLQQWLKAEARKSKHPSLLVRADGGVPFQKLAEIYSAARDAGFERIELGAEEPTAGSAGHL